MSFGNHSEIGNTKQGKLQFTTQGPQQRKGSDLETTHIWYTISSLLSVALVVLPWAHQGKDATAFERPSYRRPCRGYCKSDLVVCVCPFGPWCETVKLISKYYWFQVHAVKTPDDFWWFSITRLCNAITMAVPFYGILSTSSQKLFKVTGIPFDCNFQAFFIANTFYFCYRYWFR